MGTGTKEGHIAQIGSGRKYLLSGETSALSASSNSKQGKKPTNGQRQGARPRFGKYLHLTPRGLVDQFIIHDLNLHSGEKSNAFRKYLHLNPPWHLADQFIKAAKSCCSVLSSSSQHRTVFGNGEVSHPLVLKRRPIKKEGEMSGSTELSHFRSDRGSAIVVHLGEDHLDSCPLGCTRLQLKILIFETFDPNFLARYIHQQSFV